jgi:FdhD protein
MLLNQVKINRFKVNASGCELESDTIAVEEPLQVSLIQGATDEVYSLTMRTPGNDKELVYGLLFTEGIICKAGDIKSIEITNSKEYPVGNLLSAELAPEITLNLKDKRRRHASYSGCGLCGKTSLQALELKQSRELGVVNSQLSVHLIKSLKALLAEQPLFSNTGGSHVAGLIYENTGQLNYENSPFFEDVGRHNALDKLIGYELITNDLSQHGILVLSGRIGFELVQKAVMAGFSMIIALGAPSNLAIQAANQFGVVLVGFAKDNSFNLYTADEQRLKK